MRNVFGRLATASVPGGPLLASGPALNPITESALRSNWRSTAYHNHTHRFTGSHEAHIRGCHNGRSAGISYPGFVNMYMGKYCGQVPVLDALDV